MKTLKWLKISFVVLACCLFTGSTFAQPTNVGISVSIRAEFQGTSTLAFVAEEGDVLDYYVTASLSADQFPIFDGVVRLTLPNGTVIDLDDDLALTSGTSQLYLPVAYVVNPDDLGQQAGAEANEVRAIASVVAKADAGQTIQDVTATTNFDTVIISPCVTVVKTAECDITKEGDIFDYTITITNCGTDFLTAVSINDTMFGSLLGLGCDGLSPGEECTITLPYTVLPDDPNPLLNEVTVVYEVTGIPAITVTDTSDAEVEIVYPDFTVTKECLTDNVVADEVTFLITIANTGDVPLDFVTDEPEIAPFSLAPGGLPHQIEVTRLVSEGQTEVYNEVNVVATLPSEYVCADNAATIEKSDSDTCNILIPDFTVEKNCLEDPVEGDFADFEIIICNTGDVELSFEIDDPAAGYFAVVGPIAPGACTDPILVEVPADCVDGEVSNTAYVQAIYDREPVLDPKEASAVCPCGGLEGCTPGFWRNSPNCWCGEYQPDTLVGDVWDIPAELGSLADDTLMQAIRYGGGRGVEGAARILLRAAVASLLNACSEDVNFPLSVEDVIDGGNAALATLDRAFILALAEALDDLNNYDCPISSDKSAYPCQRETAY